jgi:hypothetical protein
MCIFYLPPILTQSEFPSLARAWYLISHTHLPLKETTMKLVTLLAAFGITSAAFANYEGTILLTCRNMPFSDLKVVTLIQRPNGSLVVVEQGDNGQVRRHNVESNSFDLGTVSLSGWYGYTRTLSRENGGWQLLKEDECSSDQYTVSCVESR